MFATMVDNVRENLPHVTVWGIALAVAVTLVHSWLAGEVGKRRHWSKRRVAALAVTLDGLWFCVLFSLQILRWEDVSHAWETYFIAKEIFDRSFSTLLKAAVE